MRPAAVTRRAAPLLALAKTVVVGIVLGPTLAHATAPDLFGHGARWMGAGGGGVAIVDDGTAALLNPAGLSRIRRPTAAVGYGAAAFRFAEPPALYWDTNRDGEIDERDPPLQYSASPPPAAGVQLAVGRHVGGKFGIGLTAYVPQANLIRFSMFEPDLPNWIMYENRPQRFVAAAGIGGEILPGVSIGASLDLLAKSRLDVALTARAAIDGGANDNADELISDIAIDIHRVNLSVVPAVAPVLGVQLDVGKLIPAIDGLVLGASWHGSVGLELDVTLDLQANVDIQGIGDLEPYTGALVALAGLDMFDHYVPQRVNLGLAYRRGDTFAFYADLRWTDWRKFQVNVARLREASLTVPLVDLTDKIVDGNDVSYRVRSTWGLRTGGDLRLPEITFAESKLRYLRLSVRGGFGFEPSPLVEQGASSAMLDTARSYFTLGTGVEVWDPFALVDGPVRLDLFGQYHVLAASALPRATDVPRAGYPINATSLPIGGSILVGGVQWSFDY